jgi:hypothetical protein
VATLFDLPVMTEEICRLVCDVFVLDDPAPAQTERALRRLTRRLADAEAALASQASC